MVTEERSATIDQAPTDSEFEKFEKLAEKIKFLNTEIDRVRDRLAYGFPVSSEDRTKAMRQEFELERLLVRAQYFIDRFG